MAYSYIKYTGNGTQTDFSFAFPYFNTSDISALVSGVSVPFTWLTAGTIKLQTAPANGAVVLIQRITPKNVAPVNFVDGSVLLESDLDTLALFSLYAVQESIDAAGKAIALNTANNWDAQNIRVTNLAEPVDAQDAVTRNYFESVYTPLLTAKVTAAAASAAAAAASAAAASTVADSATTALSAAQAAVTQKANDSMVSAAAALASQLAAAASAAAAASTVAAAGIPSTLMGKAKYILQVKPTEDGYNLVATVAVPLFFGFSLSLDGTLTMTTGRDDYSAPDFDTWTMGDNVSYQVINNQLTMVLL